MPHRRGRTLVAVVTGGLLAAGACGPAERRTTPPIRVATPGAGATAHISLPPAEADGLAPFHDWPKACGLLTPADLRAVLPQVTKIVQTPQEQKITITNLGDGDGDDHDAPDSACETRFWIAGTERNPRAEPDIVRVEDVAVGDTATVKDNFDSLTQGKSRAAASGAVECMSDDNGYYCRMSRIAFSVGAAPSLYIDRFAGQPKKMEARTYWVRSVLPKFVRSVAAKLPRR